MSERSKEHDWKSCEVKASAGSNPVLCAIKKTPYYYGVFYINLHKKQAKNAPIILQNSARGIAKRVFFTLVEAKYILET